MLSIKSWAKPKRKEREALMRNLKRLLCLTLALALVLTLAGLNGSLVGASADSFDQSLVNQFTDIKGHWANDGLTNLIGYGYMHGVGNNQAAPNDTLTTAQLVALLVRIMGGSEEADLSGYVDMDKGAWYYSEIAQGLNMGIIPNTNTNYINPKQQASREYAAYMLCRAFGLTVREPLDDFSDADKVSDWAVSSMQAMVAADAITGASGRTGRNLNPQETITRGEFAQMVYRLVRDYVQPTDSSSIRKQTFDGGLLVSRSGVTLKDCTIKGNLYVADAVGTGDITLSNTKVEGNIYARGCGDRSIHLEDGTTANSVVLINPYNPVRLVVEEESEINGVLVNNGADEVILEGEVGNVTLNVSDVDLTFEEAKADTVIINSARSTVSVDDKSTVDTMSVASSSSGVTVESEGRINRLAQMANDASLKLDGSLDYLLIGAVSDLKLELDGGISLGALDLHCSDSEITVNSDVKSISVSAFSDNLKLSLGKKAKVVAVGVASSSTDLTVNEEASVGAVTIDAPKFKGTLKSDLATLVVGAGATESEITLAKDATIDNMTMHASKSKIIVPSGATITTLNVTGKENEISGQGEVDTVNVATTASDTKVTTGNTVVANAGATKVTAGGVEVPFNKTYTTASSGKDVVRNTDGTPDGDGNKATGAGDEVATVANFELSYAAQLTASDIHSSGKWEPADLGSNFTLTKNAAGAGATYKLTGNVQKVEEFTPVHDVIAGYGTGYYVPVLVSADSMTSETNWTVTSAGWRYDKSALSTGTSYAGKMVLFLQLQPGTTSKVAYVAFDRDGEGTAYSPVTVSIDYSGVTFDGSQDLTGEIMSYPVKATAADLTTTGTLTLDAFGNFGILKTTGNMYNVTGTAKYVATAFKGNTGTVAEGTHHYVPLMVNTTAFKNGWSVAFNDGTRFTASNASRGSGCRGNLVLLLPLTATGTKTQTIYLDADGDGYVDANGTYTINLASVGLGPNATNPDDEIGTVPEGLTVNLNVQSWVATVTDATGVLDAAGEGKTAAAIDAIKAQMKADGYTGITSTEINGGASYLLAGTKSSIPSTFTFTPATGILKPNPKVNVTYTLPGAEAKVESFDAGSTLQDLIDLLKEADADVELGDFYTTGLAQDAKPISGADKVELTNNMSVAFGYYDVSDANEIVSIVNGAGVQLVRDSASRYVQKGEKVSLTFTVGATDSTDGEAIVFKDTGTLTKTGTATFTMDGATPAFKGATPDVSANAGLDSITLAGNTITITTTAGELAKVTFSVEFTVEGAVTYTMTAQETPVTPPASDTDPTEEESPSSAPEPTTPAES